MGEFIWLESDFEIWLNFLAFSVDDVIKTGKMRYLEIGKELGGH